MGYGMRWFLEYRVREDYRSLGKPVLSLSWCSLERSTDRRTAVSKKVSLEQKKGRNLPKISLLWEQRQADNIDATKAIDRESDQRSSATKLEALQKAYTHAKKEYKQSDNDTTTKEERDGLKRVKSDAKKALKDAKAKVHLADDNKSHYTLHQSTP